MAPIGKSLLQAIDKTILVIGDVMLDTYEIGDVNRLSPEAPVPIVSNPTVMHCAGGAANVALNIQAMGALVHLYGIVGSDAAGEQLKSIISCPNTLVSDKARPTTVKRRIVAGGQQLLRIDRERTSPLNNGLGEALLSAIELELPASDLIVLSDYGKGALSPLVLKEIFRIADERGVPVVADPYPPSLHFYGALRCLKPNLKEAADITGANISDDRGAEIAVHMLAQAADTKAIVLTRGPDGMTAFETGKISHVRGQKRRVYDVTGAGDTALAGLAVGLASGATLEQATKLSLTAAGCAVSKPYTSTITLDEILADIAGPECSDPLKEQLNLISSWRGEGNSIGFTNGCFDVLHAGHLAVLKTARAHCDRLILAINTDASVSRLKGETRPANPLASRVGKLNALGVADMIISFDQDTPLELINAIEPNLLVKGADYEEAEIVGAELVRSKGGDVLRVPLREGCSTTELLGS